MTARGQSRTIRGRQMPSWTANEKILRHAGRLTGIGPVAGFLLDAAGCSVEFNKQRLASMMIDLPEGASVPSDDLMNAMVELDDLNRK